MLSVKQAAEKLGVSSKTVRGLVNAGLIQHHRVGVRQGTIRISKEAIAEYLDSTLVEVQSKRDKKPVPNHRLKHIKL